MCSEKQISSDNNKLKKIAATASILVATSLSLLKLFAALYTGSLAILSSFVDSVSDVFSSIISFIAIKISAKPASTKYRYGYGKAEALSALFQAIFVAASGVFVIYEGICRFYAPSKEITTSFGISIMILSLVITIGLVFFQKYVIKKTKSLAISADSLHYVIDIATTGAVIISLVLVKAFNFIWFDTLAAIFISIYLLKNAYELGADAIKMLLDRELAPEIRQDIIDIIKTLPFVEGIHDLRTRDLGGEYIFELHLELDGELSLYKAHNLTHKAEEKIKQKYPQAQVIIHQEPAGIKEERLDDVLAK